MVSEEKYNELCDDLRQVVTVLGCLALRIERIIEKWRDRDDSMDNGGEGQSGGEETG